MEDEMIMSIITVSIIILGVSMVMEVTKDQETRINQMKDLCTSEGMIYYNYNCYDNSTKKIYGIITINNTYLLVGP